MKKQEPRSRRQVPDADKFVREAAAVVKKYQGTPLTNLTEPERAEYAHALRILRASAVADAGDGFQIATMTELAAIREEIALLRRAIETLPDRIAAAIARVSTPEAKPPARRRTG